jgi:signal transduction histidine kinase
VLREYLARWQEMSGISTSLTLDSSIVLRASQELQLVRIVQEALTNVRKHARATHASIDLRRNGHDLVATIADNGQGFNAGAPVRSTEFPQFGISTMRERAESIGGTLTVESAPGNGTTVRLRFPLHDAEA